MIVISVYLIYLLYREKKRSRDTLNRLNHMMDKKDFTIHYDESLLSLTELKFKEYIMSHNISKEKLNSEKKKIEALISDISHQIKTPLSNILLYISLLLEENLSDKSRLYINHLEAQSDKLKFLIDSLFKVSRLENGLITLDRKKNSVNKLLNAALLDYKEKAIDKNISIYVDGGEDIAAFDFKWTVEALSNVIDNAIKYTEEGGWIKLSIIPYELFVRIDIMDSGIGIKEEEKEKIFLRFYRSTEVSDKDGVGIGLYLSREILSNEGGYIKVDRNQDKGSIFSIFLPRK